MRTHAIAIMLALPLLAACQSVTSTQPARTADPSEAVLAKVQSFGNHPCNQSLARVLAGFQIAPADIEGISWSQSATAGTPAQPTSVATVRRRGADTGNGSFTAACVPAGVWTVRTAA